MKKPTLSVFALLALTLTGCREDEAYRMTTDGHAYIVIKTDCGVANILIQGVLERIYGKDFFKEEE